MSGFIAYDTIEQYLTGAWTTSPLVFENFDYQLPDEPAAFVYVEIWSIPGGFDQASIGADPRSGNLWREYGTLDLYVMTPNGTGSGAARAQADALLNLFRGQDIGTLTFLGASIGEGQPGRPFANYWGLNTSISWRRDQ